MNISHPAVKKKLLKYRRITQTGCWEWTRDIVNSGYGRVKIDYQHWYVHRLSMRIFKPVEYSESLDVLHKCDNKKCFNPEHLYSGTKSDNMRDAIARGQWKPHIKTHCKRGHEYTPRNTLIWGGDKRCKICEDARYVVRRSQ